MEKTRLSLFYVATYLSLSGVGFTFLPDLSLRLMLSNVHYETIFVRVTGLFLLGLAAIVIQSIRYRISMLYFTFIAIRILFCLGYLIFYLQTANPLFLSFLGIVGLGLVFSIFSYRLDQGHKVG